jgi:hypothetical protein
MWEKSCTDVNFGVMYFGDCEVRSISGTGESNCPRKSFEVVLGADIGYDLSLHEPINRTLVSLLVGNCNKPTGVTCGALNSPRLPPQGIALLTEEVRWSDVHQWYIDCLVGRYDIEDDDRGSQVRMKNMCSGVSCSNGSGDDSCGRNREVCQASGAVMKHPPAAKLIQKYSTYLSGKSAMPSDEVRSLDGGNFRVDTCTKTSARKKNAIHLLALISELTEKVENGENDCPSPTGVEIAAV